MLREGDTRIPSGCAIIGIFNKDKSTVTGAGIADAISTMHERSNGLGGGFAAYGIYPDHADFYALHLFYETDEARDVCEVYLKLQLNIEIAEKIPSRKVAGVNNPPQMYRYFVKPKPGHLIEGNIDESEFMFRLVMFINVQIKDAYVFSSGKNMGVFKGVGYPEDIGDFFMIDTYSAYAWTAHGRYPTNTPGWWAGSHPFALLDKTIIHNGEISSYDTNKRFVEMFGYACRLMTDTEVITYIIDYLERKQGLTLDEIASVIAAPFWSEIELMEPEKAKRLTYFRERFSSLLITGPFSIVYGFNEGMMALNDRLKLRSMVVATKGESTYIASEECAIRVLAPVVDDIFAPAGGEAVVVLSNDYAASHKGQEVVIK
jgi:glutamate synthase domain-containing protein 1